MNEINNLGRDTYTGQPRDGVPSDCPVNLTILFFSTFLEGRPLEAPPENLTWFSGCEKVFNAYVDWIRLEHGKPPETRAEFWRLLKLCFPRVKVWQGGREGKERKELLNVRFKGYYPRRYERSLAGGLTYTGWRGFKGGALK